MTDQDHDPHFVIFINVDIGFCSGKPRAEGEEPQIVERQLRFDAEMPPPVQATLGAIGIPWPPTTPDEVTGSLTAMSLAVSRMLQKNVGRIEGVVFVPTVEDVVLEREIVDAMTTFQVPVPKTREQMD